MSNIKSITIIVIYCLAISGCSVIMTNNDSPMKLDDCNLVAPIVDTSLAAALGTTTLVISQYPGIFRSKEEQGAYMVASGVLTGLFWIAAIGGYGEYGECTKELPWIKD